MFIYGGIDDNENKLLSDFWLMILNNYNWISLETKGKKPPPLSFHCSTLVLTNDNKTNPKLNI